MLQSNDEDDKQSTWTASLKRGMLRMLSKSPSGRSQSIGDPQLAPFTIPSISAVGASGTSPNDQALRSAGLGTQQDVSLSGWGSTSGGRAYMPRLTTSNKRPAVPPMAANPMPVATDPVLRNTRSLDVRPGSIQVRNRAANAAPVSPFGTDVAQTRPLTTPKGPLPGKPKQTPPEPVEESDPLLRGPSSGPLPAALSLARISPGPLSNPSTAVTRVAVSPRHSSTATTATPNRLIPVANQSSGLVCATPSNLDQQAQSQQQQQQQSGQTVQQMLTAMRQSSGKLSSPRLASGDAAAAELGTSVSGELRSSLRARAVPQSPFHCALSEKDFAQDISWRYAMGGTSKLLSSFHLGYGLHVNNVCIACVFMWLSKQRPLVFCSKPVMVSACVVTC